MESETLSMLRQLAESVRDLVEPDVENPPAHEREPNIDFVRLMLRQADKYIREYADPERTSIGLGLWRRHGDDFGIIQIDADCFVPVVFGRESGRVTYEPFREHDGGITAFLTLARCWEYFEDVYS